MTMLIFGGDVYWDPLSSKIKAQREAEVERLCNEAGRIEQEAGIWL